MKTPIVIAVLVMFCFFPSNLSDSWIDKHFIDLQEKFTFIQHNLVQTGMLMELNAVNL